MACEMLPELSFDRQLEISPRRKVEEGPAGEDMSQGMNLQPPEWWAHLESRWRGAGLVGKESVRKGHVIN